MIAGSLAAVTAGYLRSADFSNLSSSSQISYRLALKPVLAAHGHRFVRDLSKLAARHVIEEIGAKRPGMANLTRAVLSKVMAYAIEIGVLQQPPQTRRATRKAPARVRRGVLSTPFRSVGAHQLTILHNSE